MTQDILGYIPAIIFPLATLLQLLKILRDKDVGGVSAVSWFLFGVANLALYGYVGKYDELQAVSSMLVTGALNLVIALMVIITRAAPQRPAP
ncbi:MAG: hypothetical protein WBK91_02425 [Alphaproteobacteria bacterium]